MPRPMRRATALVDDRATLESWLDRALVGRLATLDADGYPVVKPLSFAYEAGHIYFHSALEGEKLDDIRRDSRVGFEVDHLYAIVPSQGRGCQTACLYHSVVVRGRARILDDTGDDARKEHVLRLLVEKYAPGRDIGPGEAAHTAVVEIAIQDMSGKQQSGQGWSAERRLAVACALRERGGEAARAAIEWLGLPPEQ